MLNCTVLFLATAGALGVQASMERVELPEASVRFEQNATDEDLEVVFEITGDDEGLSALTITGPNGRKVVDFEAPDASTLGIRQFELESPEPRDLAALKAAYPEGVYEFSGKTASGTILSGESSLSHRLPTPATIVQPAPDAEDVPLNVPEISWRPGADATSYIVEIEQEELEVSLTATLPGSSNSLALPSGFLSPGREYKIGVGTVSAEGNISFVESTFTTAR